MYVDFNFDVNTWDYKSMFNVHEKRRESYSEYWH